MQKTTFMLLVALGMAVATLTQADIHVIGAVFDLREDIRDRDYSATEDTLWAAEELELTNINVRNGSNITIYAPRIVIHSGFRVESGSAFRAGVPVFQVHFVNMVDPLLATAPSNVVPGTGIDFSSMSSVEFKRFCHNEIAILNYYFKSDDGRQLVSFEMRDAENWRNSMQGTDFYDCTSKGSNEDDCPGGYAGSGHVEAFNESDFDAFRDDTAINVIFFDNPERDASGANTNLTYGGPPMLIIDYARVDENLGHDHDSDGIVDDCGLAPYSAYTDGSTYAHAGTENNGMQDDDHEHHGVKPHEIGHVFGLDHVYRQHPYNSSDIWDQIMTSIPNGMKVYAESCNQFCQYSECQEWYRSSFFAKDAITRVDAIPGIDLDGDGDVDYYKYIQGYRFQPSKYKKKDSGFVDNFEGYGQAEIIMNMAYHLKKNLD